MKEITAIIQPQTLARVIEALHTLPHFPGVTVIPHVHGQGRGRGVGGVFRLSEDTIPFHDKVLLLVACEAPLAESIVAAIATAAHTGNQGDGLITVKDVARVVRIGTGETAGQAL